MTHLRGERRFADDDLAVRLGRAVLRVRRQMRRNSPAALTVGQVSLLGTIVRHGPIGVRQLADAEALPSPAVTRLVGKLEADGLVLREVNPADRRGVLVAATPKGRAAFAAHEAATSQWLIKRLALLGPAEREDMERVVELLERIAGDANTR
jgi:DNA-binding MarR family transcriptional regulator